MSGLAQQSTQTQPNLMQQFCLRWHNHQTSLLASLPLLLDQSHLTDVTLSAEGRTVRAHRVVLSACSTFFSELFRTVEPPYHPVIVLPGTSFGAVVALLTFMYSGEVNVFEEQISTLLALAETLGVKGLADFNGNVSKSSPPSNSDTPTPIPKEPETPTSSPPPNKIPTPLENLFAKTFPLCPTMMSSPLNFSQSALNKGAEIFARYQNQYRINQQADRKSNDSISTTSNIDENGNKKNLLSIDNKMKKSKSTDMRKIDKIAENLRSASNSAAKTVQSSEAKQLLPAHTHLPSLMLKSPPFGNLSHRFSTASTSDDTSYKGTLENLVNLREHQHHATSPFLSTEIISPDASIVTPPTTLAPAPKTPNSKIYATCFICHKQLSNQYNLRVHLETHQNVRYACSVCSHVSRSKDALRKHVSYRHPGTPSPCDNESKRKRSRTSSAALSQLQRQQQTHIIPQTSMTHQLNTISPEIPTSSPQNSHIKTEIDLSPSSNITQNLSMGNVHAQNQLHGFTNVQFRGAHDPNASILKRDTGANPTTDTADYLHSIDPPKCAND